MVRMRRIYLEFCEKGWQNEWMNLLGMKRQALHGEWLGFDEKEEENFFSLGGRYDEFLNFQDGTGRKRGC